MRFQVGDRVLRGGQGGRRPGVVLGTVIKVRQRRMSGGTRSMVTVRWDTGSVAIHEDRQLSKRVKS